MIIILDRTATPEQQEHIVARLRERGFGANISGVEQIVIGAIGLGPADRATLAEQLSGLPYVERVVPVLKKYKLASLEFQPEPTVVHVGPVRIGGPEVVVIAGPCSVESREQIMETARAVRAAGGTLLRGGAFKPRTSPYDFQGMGEQGLQLLAEARAETGLPIVTEVMDPHEVELVSRYADVLQIGARNMQNYRLLSEVGRGRLPVLLKRGGMYPTIENWLLAAEYILAQGNRRVILCERGLPVLGDTDLRRNLLDISAVPILKGLTHLPVIVDPSHGTGKWQLVAPVSLAAVAAGADGLIIEVHPNPELATSDGAQSLDLAQLTALMKRLPAVAAAIDRTIAAPPTVSQP